MLQTSCGLNLCSESNHYGVNLFDVLNPPYQQLWLAGQTAWFHFNYSDSGLLVRPANGLRMQEQMKSGFELLGYRLSILLF